jgi:hypothetical protein
MVGDGFGGRVGTVFEVRGVVTRAVVVVEVIRGAVEVISIVTVIGIGIAVGIVGVVRSRVVIVGAGVVVGIVVRVIIIVGIIIAVIAVGIVSIVGNVIIVRIVIIVVAGSRVVPSGLQKRLAVARAYVIGRVLLLLGGRHVITRNLHEVVHPPVGFLCGLFRVVRCGLFIVFASFIISVGGSRS